jgi:hypothetical protein
VVIFYLDILDFNQINSFPCGLCVLNLPQKNLLYCDLKSIFLCRVLVTHTCNPSYSGSRDQEDQGLKPAGANISGRPYLEKPFTKIRLEE